MNAPSLSPSASQTTAAVLDTPPLARSYATSIRKSWTVGTLNLHDRRNNPAVFLATVARLRALARDRSVGPVVQLFLKRNGASEKIVAVVGSVPIRARGFAVVC